MTNYPDKPDERLLAHFRENPFYMECSEENQVHLFSLGYGWHPGRTHGRHGIHPDRFVCVSSSYRAILSFANVQPDIRFLTLDQLQAEVAEVLGTPVPTEPVEKPLSRQKFVSYVKRISALEAELSELALRQLAVQEERKDLHRILSNSGRVNTHLDESGDLDGYEWSDDNFKTYTGRKV